ncbi:MAG: Gfo/Idh/MocA family oxidoreductase, partial [Chloroflexi bacterium]
MPSSERLRVGVVGAGIGTAHIRGYAGVPERFEVVALCDIDADRARPIAEEHHIPRLVTDLAELCRMDVDVIDICTPPHLHFDQIQQVLAAGKHAVCEKPLVSSLREVDELMRVEAGSGRRIMPIFQYRF